MKNEINRTALTHAQQMAKCLTMLGCHLHATCGRCIQVGCGSMPKHCTEKIHDCQ